jgi:hypothetical protein
MKTIIWKGALEMEIATIKSQSNVFTEVSGIQVSEQAQRLIQLCLDAIENDPHPAWDISSEDRKRLSNEMAIRLPSILFEIHHSLSYPQKTITTYDVLHWLEENLTSICPITKRPANLEE